MDTDVSAPGTSTRDPVTLSPPPPAGMHLTPGEVLVGAGQIATAAVLGGLMGGPPGALAGASGAAATIVTAAAAQEVVDQIHAAASATATEDIPPMVPMDLQRDPPQRPTYATKRDKSGKVMWRGDGHELAERKRAERARTEAMQARRDKRAEQTAMGAAERIVAGSLQGVAVGTGLGFVAGGGNPITGIAGGAVGGAIGAVDAIAKEVISALAGDGKRTRLDNRVVRTDDDADNRGKAGKYFAHTQGSGRLRAARPLPDFDDDLNTDDL
jgi:hypothetical protein